MDILLSIIGGLAIGAVLGLLGGGGALMAIPVLIYALHYPFRTAVATSLVLVALGALPAMAMYWRKQQIDWMAALLMGVGGIGGAFFGTRLSPLFEKEWLLGLLIVLMAISAWRLIQASPSATETAVDAPKHQYFKLMLAGLGVGILTGLVGVGGGFLLVPALLVFGGLPARNAVATSLVIIDLNAISGASGYRELLPLDHPSFWWLVGGSLVGSVLGFVISSRLSSNQIKKGFSLLLLTLILLLIIFPPTR